MLRRHVGGGLQKGRMILLPSEVADRPDDDGVLGEPQCGSGARPRVDKRHGARRQLRPVVNDVYWWPPLCERDRMNGLRHGP